MFSMNAKRKKHEICGCQKLNKLWSDFPGVFFIQQWKIKVDKRKQEVMVLTNGIFSHDYLCLSYQIWLQPGD